MPLTILDRMRVQDAVYWAPAVVSSNYGKPIPSDPISLIADEGTGVRWDEVTEDQLDKSGRQWTSKGMVYTGMDVALGGILYKGKVTDPGFDAKHPLQNVGAYEIKKIDKIPTLRGDQFLRIAYL